jgi:4-hydroxy-tetrahydrodipicolinate synthase
VECPAVSVAVRGVSVVKEALAQLGLAPRAVRPPSRELPQARRDVVAAPLARWKDDGWL